jgi:hypothetical protein
MALFVFDLIQIKHASVDLDQTFELIIKNTVHN